MRHRWSVWMMSGAAIALASSIGRAQQVTVVERAELAADTTAFMRPVTVSFERTPLRKAVLAVAKAARIQFQFQREVLDAVTDSMSLHVKNVPLGKVMDQLLSGTHLGAVAVRHDLISIEPMAGVVRADGGIAGIIVDGQTKRAIPSATVTVEKTKMVTRTDDRGAFRLTGVPAGTYVLVVRRLGYSVMRKTVTVTENSVATADMTLSATATPLAEVVTTVTGQQRKVEVANAIGVIKADSLMKEAPITTLSQLLTSRVPGLTVSQGQGTVGGDIKLQIRGLSSITQSVEPIVIVDGVRFDSRSAKAKGVGGYVTTESVSPLNDLNPNDIETVEVVKGPSAATLYGTDASNGVIVITTKRGKAGPTRYSMYGSRDINEIPRPSLPNDEVYYGWGRWTNWWNGPNDTTSDCSLFEAGGGGCEQDSVTHGPSVNADPSFSFFKPATSYTSGGNVSGGSEKLRFFAGASYNNLLGALSIPDTVLRYMRQLGRSIPSELLRPNTQTMLNLQANASASPSSTVDVTVSGNYVRSSTRSVSASFAPWSSAVTQASAYTNGSRDRLREAMGFAQATSIEDDNRYVASTTGRYSPTTWLSFNSTAGFDNAARTHVETNPKDTASGMGQTGTVRDIRANSLGLSATVGASANFRRAWANFRTSVGTQYNRRTDDNMNVLGNGLPVGTTSINYTSSKSVSHQYDQSVTLGSYIEEVVGLDDRIFITGAVRSDGATGFGDGYKSATYPKLGLSWLLSKEPWMPRIGILDELRFRSAYGISGRQARAIAKLPSVSLLTTNVPRGPYMSMGTIGNPELRPERSKELETGFDAGFFAQRVTMGLTWYNRETKDLIVSQLLPSGFGSVNRNIALVTGHGFEAQLTATILDTRNASLSVSMSHAKDQTLLKELGSAFPERYDFGGYDEGYPLGARFTRPVRGYIDKDGNGILGISWDTAKTELLYSDTVEYVGPTQAPLRQNMTVTLGLLGQRVRVSSVFDREAGGTSMLGYPCDRCRAKYDPTTPLDEQFAFLKGGLFGHPVEVDAVRLREITTYVMLPMSLAQKMRISTLSMSVSARNLKQWTSFQGADPESVPLDAKSTVKYGVAIPQARTWTVRFDLGL